MTDTRPEQKKTGAQIYADLWTHQAKETSKSESASAKRARSTTGEKVKSLLLTELEEKVASEPVQTWLKTTVYPLLVEVALLAADIDPSDPAPDSPEPVNTHGWVFTKTAANRWQGPPITPDNQEAIHKFLSAVEDRPDHSCFKRLKTSTAVPNICPRYFYRSKFSLADLTSSVIKALHGAKILFGQHPVTGEITLRNCALSWTDKDNWNGGFVYTVDEEVSHRSGVIDNYTLTVTEAVVLMASCLGPLCDTEKYQTLAVYILKALKSNPDRSRGIHLWNRGESDACEHNAVKSLRGIVGVGHEHNDPILLRMLDFY